MGVTTDKLMRSLRQTKDLSSFLQKNSQKQSVPTLSAHLEGLLILKERKKADVIRDSNLAQTYAYQIFDGKRNPTRDKLLQLAIAFPLTLQETDQLLKIAEVNGLYIRNRRDSIIMFGIDNSFTLGRINLLLESEGEAPLY